MSRRSDAMLRLMGAKERNELDAERRAGMSPRFRSLVNRGAPSDHVAVADGLFITPPEIAARMVALAQIPNGATVLEPSAGTGRLIDAINDAAPSAHVVAVEQCPRLCRHLFEKYQTVTLKAGDFMDIQPGQFDRIVMNPPFRRGTDVRHILHARSMLKPGGKLVSLCYDGAAQNKHLRPLAATWERLPDRSFAAEGTNAGVVLCSFTYVAQ